MYRLFEFLCALPFRLRGRKKIDFPYKVENNIYFLYPFPVHLFRRMDYDFLDKFIDDCGGEFLYPHILADEVLKQIVWSRIFDVTALFFDDIMAFHEMMYQQRSAETEKEMKRRKREVGQARKRIAELDRIFKRIYEDDISGTISHDRFLKLSAEYEAEQRELEEKVKADQQEVDTYEQNKSDFDSFAAIIRKYVGIKELTPAIVNEFIIFAGLLLLSARTMILGHRPYL